MYYQFLFTDRLNNSANYIQRNIKLKMIIKITKTYLSEQNHPDTY